MGWRVTEKQQLILDYLRRTGEWYPGCGWYYKDIATTVDLLDALCSKGLAITYNNELRYELRK